MTPVSIEDINFEWRAEGDIVDAFVKGQHELTNQEKQYRNRTELFITELAPRNLSLKVSHISPNDRKVYECWFFIDEDRNGYLDKWLLKVAGHYSEPLIKGPAKTDLRNRDADFICAATGGYPEPKVHWFINQKKVPPQSNRINTTITNISSEKYDVKSVLTINMTDDTSVYCTVENELLKEERKSTDIQYLVKTKNELHSGDRRHWWIAVIVAVALLVIIVIVAAVFRSRNNSASSGMLNLNVSSQVSTFKLFTNI
uniref:Ig-like domain-containing protein n=1 Tax=Erpetoichthys calabaricus TaxID=27687 RepID=A0A8C4TB64_ERPCA